MSHHHHDHEHPHGHQHDHDHEARPSDGEKLKTMVRHWINHNEDHARSYRDWAARARAAGREEAARILEEVAAATGTQNEQLQRILTLSDAD